MLEVRDLRVAYGASAPAVDGVDLRVGDGECVTLLGANGAGKSSLFAALSGLVKAAGEIRFDGADVRALRPAAVVRRGIAHCPEGRRLFPDLSVEKNLRLGAYARRDGRAAQDAALERVCTLFPPVREKLRAPAGALSGGQQQMVAIGRALMAQPRLLLLDEPSLGLAPRAVEAVLAAIVEIVRGGTSVLLAEQNAGAALEIADRGYVLAGGRVVLEGAAATLRANEGVRKAFIGA